MVTALDPSELPAIHQTLCPDCKPKADQREPACRVRSGCSGTRSCWKNWPTPAALPDLAPDVADVEAVLHEQAVLVPEWGARWRERWRASLAASATAHTALLHVAALQARPVCRLGLSHAVSGHTETRCLLI